MKQQEWRVLLLKEGPVPFSSPKKNVIAKICYFSPEASIPFLRHHILDAAEALVVKAEKYIAQLTKEANKLVEQAGRKTIKKGDGDLASKP